MATMSDLFVLCHEWLYTDQFLKTVLWLDFKKLPALGKVVKTFTKSERKG